VVADESAAAVGENRRPAREAHTVTDGYGVGEIGDGSAMSDCRRPHNGTNALSGSNREGSGRYQVGTREQETADVKTEMLVSLSTVTSRPEEMNLFCRRSCWRDARIRRSDSR
jgi:hypothetical protein